MKNSEGCAGKYSVDVFVSCGEPFVPLEGKHMKYLIEMGYILVKLKDFLQMKISSGRVYIQFLQSSFETREIYNIKPVQKVLAPFTFSFFVPRNNTISLQSYIG